MGQPALVKNILVIDASALIGGIDPNILGGTDLVTTSGVVKEIKTPTIRKKTELSISNGRLKILMPTEESMRIIEQICEETGDLKFLSSVDKSILALTIMLQDDGKHPILLTDDYSIQNVAHTLHLTFQSVQEKGIRKRLKWTIYCPGCKKNFPSKTNLNECDACGTPLKRYSLK